MRRDAPAVAGGSRLSGLPAGGASAVAILLAVALGAVLAPAAPAAAQTLMTQEEALELAFPAPTRVDRRTAYLTRAQLERARRLAGADVDIDQGIVTYYVGYRDRGPVGVAYFDAHRVRTKAEVVMVVVTPEARVGRMDVLKFMEPSEYLAPDGWIAQIEGHRLDDELSLNGGVRTLTGATLTARALTRAARRVLALHAVIAGPEAGP